MEIKKILVAAARVATTNIRLLGGKIVHGRKLRYGLVTCLALTDSVSISNSASINFGRFLHTRGGCSFNVQEFGSLTFGRAVFLNKGCLFNCHSSISVGDGCEFGPGVMVYDHDHSFRGGVFKTGEYLYGDVVIGENCWIGAGTIILRGTVIGDGCVIGAGSIVKGHYPPRTLILQKRSTELSSLQ